MPARKATEGLLPGLVEGFPPLVTALPPLLPLFLRPYLPLFPARFAAASLRLPPLYRRGASRAV